MPDDATPPPLAAEPTNDDANSLEAPETPPAAAAAVDTAPSGSTLGDLPAPTDGGTLSPAPEPAPDSDGGQQKPGLIKRLRRRFNIWLLLFIFILVVAGGIVLAAYIQSRHTNNSPTNHLQTENLSTSTLQQLANSDATVGNNQTVLNVQSSAVFAGQVLVRQQLQVASNLQVGGNLQVNGTTALQDLTVAGTSQFGQVNINKNLAVAGTAAVQGAATIGKSLQVGGSGTFSGAVSAPQIVASSLQLNGDLTLTHHIDIGGPTPSRSGGSALGSGGSASVSGSDTAGSISINTGGSPAAGCFVTVNFTTHFNATPHVLVTPIGSAAGGLAYYVNRSASSFSVCDATAPPGGSSFGFDYFVLD